MVVIPYSPVGYHPIKNIADTEQQIIVYSRKKSIKHKNLEFGDCCHQIRDAKSCWGTASPIVLDLSYRPHVIIILLLHNFNGKCPDFIMWNDRLMDEHIGMKESISAYLKVDKELIMSFSWSP